MMKGPGSAYDKTYPWSFETHILRNVDVLIILHITAIWSM